MIGLIKLYGIGFILTQQMNLEWTISKVATNVSSLFHGPVLKIQKIGNEQMTTLVTRLWGE